MKLNILGLIVLVFISFSYAQNCSNNLRKECARSLGSRSACDPDDDSGWRYIQTEEGFRYCSNLVKKCECWLREQESEDDWVGNIGIREALEQAKKQAKKNAIKAEEERRKQATQDSLRKSITEEIFALIEDNAEINLILDKCDTYNRRFTPLLQECKNIQDSIKIAEITALLKANKLEEGLDKCNERKSAIEENNCLKQCKQLVFSVSGGERRLKASSSEEECFEKCGISFNEKIADLCEKQLVDKVKKLPKNKISTIPLANVYYECDNKDNCQKIVGWIIQNDGQMVLVEDISFGHIFMLQHKGHIGNCMLRPTRQIPFGGYAKYLGEKIYTTVLGVKQSVPNYQLLWCD